MNYQTVIRVVPTGLRGGTGGGKGGGLLCSWQRPVAVRRISGWVGWPSLFLHCLQVARRSGPGPGRVGRCHQLAGIVKTSCGLRGLSSTRLGYHKKWPSLIDKVSDDAMTPH